MSLFECVLNHCLRKLKLSNSLLSRKLKLYYRWIKSPSLATPTPFSQPVSQTATLLPLHLSLRLKCCLPFSSHYQNFVFSPLHATCVSHLIVPSVDHPNIHIKLWRCFL